MDAYVYWLLQACSTDHISMVLEAELLRLLREMERNDRMYYLGLGVVVTQLHYPFQAGSMDRAGLHLPVCVATIPSPNPNTSVSALSSS